MIFFQSFTWNLSSFGCKKFTKQQWTVQVFFGLPRVVFCIRVICPFQQIFHLKHTMQKPCINRKKIQKIFTLLTRPAFMRRFNIWSTSNDVWWSDIFEIFFSNSMFQLKNTAVSPCNHNMNKIDSCYVHNVKEKWQLFKEPLVGVKFCTLSAIYFYRQLESHRHWVLICAKKILFEFIFTWKIHNIDKIKKWAPEKGKSTVQFQLVWIV